MRKKKQDNQEVLHLKDQLARALADYDNFRKRTERDGESLRFVLTARIVNNFLPVLDMLYEAQKHLNDSGIGLTIKEFEDTLKVESVEMINPGKGEQFNEQLHEAIDTASEEGLKEGQIINCVLRGWKFRDLPAQAGGQVIRHAKVVVNK